MIASKMTDDVVVEKVYGDAELQKRLQALAKQGIRPDNVLSDGENYYTIIFENKKILNEG